MSIKTINEIIDDVCDEIQLICDCNSSWAEDYYRARILEDWNQDGAYEVEWSNELICDNFKRKYYELTSRTCEKGIQEYINRNKVHDAEAFVREAKYYLSLKDSEIMNELRNHFNITDIQELVWICQEFDIEPDTKELTDKVYAE